MRQRRSHGLEIASEELNLVPYMDIMVNLIMFMLFSTTSFIQMKIINVSVPQIGDPVDLKNEKQMLNVLIGIVDKQGFLISVDGAFLEGTPEGKPTVSMLSSAEYDFGMLTEKMEQVKLKQPEQSTLTIVPDKSVDYKTLVKTMDAIRRDRQSQLLFPNVLLGVQ